MTKFQQEIDEESENRAELARMERETTDTKHKAHLRDKIAKSDEKIQALALLMLHYCAGLQHCLDQEELERQKKLEMDQRMEEEIQEEQQNQIKEAESLQSGEAIGIKVTHSENDEQDKVNGTTTENESFDLEVKNEIYNNVTNGTMISDVNEDSTLSSGQQTVSVVTDEQNNISQVDEKLPEVKQGNKENSAISTDERGDSTPSNSG